MEAEIPQNLFRRRFVNVSVPHPPPNGRMKFHLCDGQNRQLVPCSGRSEL